MKTITGLLLTSLLVLWAGISSAMAQTYDHSLTITHMEFHWTIDGDKLKFKLVGKTDGWVGVGFNATNKMKGADIIIGYVEDGETKVSDDFGVRTIGHRPDEQSGGRDTIISYSGTESDGFTTIECVIALDSGDKEADTVIQPQGKTTVILAYGSRDSFRMGHRHAATLEVNLSSGEHSITAGH